MNLKNLIDILSWTSAILTLSGYYLVTKKIINAYSWAFQISTFIARICFLSVNLYRQTYPFALMDATFLIIAFSTMIELWRSKA